MREVHQSHFTQPLANKLSVQGAILVALAAALALSVGLGTGSAGDASFSLGTLGAGSGALIAAAVTAHVAVGVYRLRREPLTEREALALVTVEDVASYLGIATGGLLVAATVVIVLVSVVTGIGPSLGASAVTETVTVGTAVVASLTLGAGRYLDGRLPE